MGGPKAERGGSKKSAKAIVVWSFLIGLALQGVEAAYGASPNDVEKVRRTKSCQKCDLSGANLSFASLSGADLSGADLHDAYLNGAFLLGANLSGANLSGAVVGSAYLAGANLSGANLTGTNLTGAILDGATWTDGSTCESGSVGKCKK